MFAFRDALEAGAQDFPISKRNAVSLAHDFVAHKGLMVHAEPVSVRLARAAFFNALLHRDLYPSDFWVVEFLKLQDESPGSIMVEVNSNTGDIHEIYVGSWIDRTDPSEPG